MAEDKPLKKLDKPTTLRFPSALLSAAGAKAARLGVSRTVYIQQVIRRDLGQEGIDLAENSVLG